MLHNAEVTREVNFEIRGNPWKLDSRAEAMGTIWELVRTGQIMH